MKRVINFIVTVILYAVLPFVVAVLITSKIAVYGVRSFVVLTGSMEPAVHVGSIIFTRKNTEGAVYEKGDIIAFEQGDRTVTHRIADMKEENGKTVYITRGDANNTNDADPVTADKIIGKDVAVLPAVGRFIVFLKTLPGFIGVIIVPAVLYILYELWNIKKEIEKNTEKKVMAKLQAQVSSQ